MIVRCSSWNQESAYIQIQFPLKSSTHHYETRVHFISYNYLIPFLIFTLNQLNNHLYLRHIFNRNDSPLSSTEKSVKEIRQTVNPEPEILWSKVVVYAAGHIAAVYG